MKRLLLLLAAGAATATLAAPAHATIVVCALPVQVNCFYWTDGHYEHCGVWAAGRCLDDLIKN